MTDAHNIAYTVMCDRRNMLE